MCCIRQSGECPWLDKGWSVLSSVPGRPWVCMRGSDGTKFWCTTTARRGTLPISLWCGPVKEAHDWQPLTHPHTTHWLIRKQITHRKQQVIRGTLLLFLYHPSMGNGKCHKLDSMHSRLWIIFESATDIQFFSFNLTKTSLRPPTGYVRLLAFSGDHIRCLLGQWLINCTINIDLTYALTFKTFPLINPYPVTTKNPN